jgi:hypothetical protein
MKIATTITEAAQAEHARFPNSPTIADLAERAVSLIIASSHPARFEIDLIKNQAKLDLEEGAHPALTVFASRTGDGWQCNLTTCNEAPNHRMQPGLSQVVKV